MNLINITSVPADTIPADTIQLVARWKSTDNRPIDAMNRARAVMLPATIWGDANIAATAHSPAFALFVNDAVEELAKSYLSHICESSNWMRTTVPQEDFTLSSLLSWQQEQSALSGRLSGDIIKSWASQSTTITSFRRTSGDKKADALVGMFVKLAAPNHGWSKDRASRMLANIFAKEDADNNTGLRVMLKLQAIRDKEETQPEDLF